ncbi:uncharacterized protein LOC120338481 isoform X1 [Styela clava]
MSESEKQQISPSVIDLQICKSDLDNSEIFEADPAVQQIIESDVRDHNSSINVNNTGNVSPPQPQYGPIIQDLGSEDEIHSHQGSGQEYQVEEPCEGPQVVQQPAQQQAVQQLQTTQDGQESNVIIKQVHYHRTLHYHVAPVYQGSVIKGDIVGSKVEARDTNIGAIGGSQQPLAIGGSEEQAALAWLGEVASTSSQVPALCGSEQPPALPWHEEEREVLHSGNSSVSNQPLALPAPELQMSPPSNGQLEENMATTPAGQLGTQSRPAVRQIEPSNEETEQTETQDSRDSTLDRPSVQSHAVEEKSFVGEDTDITTPKVTGTQQSPVIRGPKQQAALPWLGEGTSGISAVDDPEQRPALSWHEGEGTHYSGGSLASNETLLPTATEACASLSMNEESQDQMQALVDKSLLVSAKSRKRTNGQSADVRHCSEEDEISEDEYDIESSENFKRRRICQPTTASNSRQTHARHQRNKSRPTPSNLTESQEKDEMNPTDSKQSNDANLATNKRDIKVKQYETSILKMTEMYNKERDIQTLIKFKSLLTLIEVFWTKILCKMTITNYERQFVAPEKLWSNLTDEISSERSSEITMKPYISKIKEVFKLGEEFFSNDKYIHAIVAFYATAKLHRHSGKANETLRGGILSCFEKAGLVVEKIQRSQQTADVAKNHVIPLMYEMIDFLKQIQSPNQLMEKLETKSKEFFMEKKFIPAAVALHIKAQLHKDINEGDDSLHGVLLSIEQISSIIEDKIEQKQTKALDHLMSLNNEMTDFLGLIQISNYSRFIEEIQIKATGFDLEQKFISAVVLYYVTAKLHQLNNKGNQTVIGIEQSVERIKDIVTKKMSKQDLVKKIVMDYVIPLVHEMITFLRSIKGSSHKVKVEKEAWCLYNIGFCYDYCDDYQEYANMNESATVLMNAELENEGPTYRLYGICLYYAGEAYDRMGKMEKAVELYKKSLEATKNANDYLSIKNKNAEIKLTKRSLKMAESKLRK